MEPHLFERTDPKEAKWCGAEASVVGCGRFSDGTLQFDHRAVRVGVAVQWDLAVDAMGPGARAAPVRHLPGRHSAMGSVTTNQLPHAPSQGQETAAPRRSLAIPRP